MTISFEDALALHRQGLDTEAEAAYQAVVTATPTHADALNNLALLLKKRGAYVEAEAAYRRSIAAKQETPEVFNNLGVLYLEINRLADAEAALKEAIRQRPGYSEAYNNLGNLLQGQRRHADAELAYRQVLDVVPGELRALVQRADAAQANGRMDEANACRQRARMQRSTLAESAWNLSLLYLLQGRYAEGWPLHEARFDTTRAAPVPLPPQLPCPMWRGEPLTGKAILVWCEQGFGDEIQFARYLPWLKAQGASRVTLVCKAPLVDLLKTVAGVDEVLPAEGQLVMAHPDFWVMPLSLGFRHVSTLANLPAQLPYLSVPAERAAAWADKLPPRDPNRPRRVGLVWAGSAGHRNDGNRSLPGLEALAPLWSVPGIEFISLQKGEQEAEAQQPPSRQKLRALGHLINDFADTAAIVQQLDLVICVDTAVAHVAGALGKPCWVLLPWMGTDWRWQLDGDSSPWYPQALRLFRQPALGDWASVIASVVAALQPQPVAKPAAPAKKKRKKKS